MPKGRSYKNDNWTAFQKQTYSLFKDDFVHQKLLTVKTSLEGKTGGINLKETVDVKDKAIYSSGQSKFWFELPNARSLFTRVQHNALTLSYDNGIQTKQDMSFNWYGSAESTRGLQQISWRGGLQAFTNNWSTNFMLQFNQANNVLSFYHKAGYQKNNWNFNHYKVIDLTNRALKQVGFLMRHRQVTDDRIHDVFFRIQNSPRHAWNLDESQVHFDIVGAQGNFSSGFQIGSTVANLKQGIKPWLNSLSAAMQIKYPQNNTIIKLKACCQNSSAAISVKHLIQGYGSYTWGVRVSQIGLKNVIKFGLQIDLNL